MERDIAKTLAGLMSKDDNISWLKLFKDRKVSRDFINNFINIVQKTSTGQVRIIILEIREALEDGISEEAIIWLYNPDAEFNKFYSKEILSKQQTLGEEPTKTYWNLRLNEGQRKKLRNAFKDGLTIEQVSLFAKSRFSEEAMDKFIKYLKLGVGLNIDFDTGFSNIFYEMEREAKSKLEEILYSM